MDELYHAHLAHDLGGIRESIGELKSSVRNLIGAVAEIEKQIATLSEEQSEHREAQAAFRAAVRVRGKIVVSTIGIVSAAIGAATSYVLGFFTHGTPPLH